MEFRTTDNINTNSIEIIYLIVICYRLTHYYLIKKNVYYQYTSCEALIRNLENLTSNGQTKKNNRQNAFSYPIVSFPNFIKKKSSKELPEYVSIANSSLDKNWLFKKTTELRLLFCYQKLSSSKRKNVKWTKGKTLQNYK